MQKRNWWQSEDLWLSLYLGFIALGVTCTCIWTGFWLKDTRYALWGIVGGAVLVLPSVAMFISHLQGDPLEDEQENKPGEQKILTNQEHARIS